jgi:hypothetical protein
MTAFISVWVQLRFVAMAHGLYCARLNESGLFLLMETTRWKQPVDGEVILDS